jgi:RND family efflux transporter MFP subunit
MRLNRFGERARKCNRLFAILGWLPISALSLIIGSGCGHDSKANVKTEEALEVSTTSPSVQPLFRRYILQPGIVKSYEETPIYTKLAGYLETVNVDIGYKVKKDQLLGELWVPEVKERVLVKLNKTKQGEADVRQARETHKAAKANIETWEAKVLEAVASVKVAKADNERWDKEYISERMLLKDPNDPSKGVLSPLRVEQADFQRLATKAAWKEAESKQKSAETSLAESKAKCSQAAADVEVAKANLAVWKAEWEEEVAWLGYARITAPFDGEITRRNVHTGHFLQPSNSGTTSKSAEPLFVVMRTDKMRVVIFVPENDAPLVKDGAEAVVRLQAFPDNEIKCKVTRNSGALDPEERTLRVEIFLDSPKNGITLKPGMYSNVSITAEIPNALTLPSDTILVDGNRPGKYCFMLEDGKARRVNIRAGSTNDKFTEILYKQAPPSTLGGEGKWVKFTGNEKVITSNLTSIQDGQAARGK